MDSAWIGVIGVGIGAFATFAGSAYAQWRGEKVRAADRAADEKRWREERALEDERWRRDKRHERKQQIRDEWAAARRATYLEFGKWAMHLFEQLGRAQGHFEIAGNPGIFLDNDEAWSRLRQAYEEMVLLASPYLRERSQTVYLQLSETNKMFRASDVDISEIASRLESHVRDMHVTVELIRAELGIIDGSEPLPRRRPPKIASKGQEPESPA